MLLGTLIPLLGASSPHSPGPLYAPPAPLSLTLPAAADAWVLSSSPDRNLGGSRALQVGADPTNSTVTRTALRFSVASIPSTAQILSANLSLAQSQGGAGTRLDLHRIQAPWVEGGGTEFMYKQAIAVREVAGVNRTREPVDLHLTLPAGVNPTVQAADFRLYDDASGAEVPTQIYNVTMSGGNIASLNIVFPSSNRRLETRTYTLYYGTILRAIPPWRTRTLPPTGGLSPYLNWPRPVGTLYATPAVADLVGDGKLEVIVGGADSRIHVIWSNGTEWWASPTPYPSAINWHLAVADLDNDGKQEIIFGTANGLLYAVHADGTPYWDTAGKMAGPIQGAFAVADTNGDGRKEVYVAGYGDHKFYGFNYNGSLLWSYQVPAPTDPTVGTAVDNVTGDSAFEIVGNTNGRGEFFVFRTNWSMGAPLAPIIAAPLSGTSVTSLTLVSPSIADTAATGQPLILWGTQQNPRGEFAIDPIAGTVKWSYSTGLNSDHGGQVVVDWGNDWQLETVFTQTTGPGAITALNATGFLLFSAPMQANNTNTFASPSAADVNMDGQEDILAGGFDGALYIVNSAGTILRRYQLDSPIRSTPLVADLDGDGTMEIVVCTNTRTFVIPTGSLGHDFRVGGYNIRHTGRWLDGNSPDGATLLRVPGLPAPVSLGGGTGITWNTRDGSVGWVAPGVDSDAAVLASDTSRGAGGGVWWNITDIAQRWVNNTFPNTGVLVQAGTEAVANLLAFSSREAGLQGPTLTITYINDVAPRITSRIPDQVKPEDTGSWALNLAGYAYDPNDPIAYLRWSLSGLNTSLVQVQGDGVTGNMVLTFSTLLNINGKNLVTIYLRDPDNNFDSQQFWINITPVDDPPSFGPPSLLYVHYDKPYTFDFTWYMSDVDDPTASLVLTTDDPTHTTVAGHSVTFTYGQALKDTWQFVVVTVRDPGGNSASRVIGVRVTSDNPPELRAPLPDVALKEGETRLAVFDLDDYFTDPDQDSLFFTSGNIHVNITIHPDHTVDFRAPRGWSGTEFVTFRARDPTGAIAEDTIEVTVIHVNNPPTIKLPPLFVIHYNYNYTFNVTPYISDLDNTTDQLRIYTSNPANVTVAGKNLIMHYGPTLRGVPYPYDDFLTVYITDGINTTFALTSVRVTNDFPPELTRTLPDVSFDEDTILRNGFNGTLNTFFRDVDSSTIYYSSGNVNVNVTINLNLTVDFGARANWNGRELVTFRATDDRYAFVEDSIQVVVNPVDDAPAVQPIPTQDRPRAGSWFLDLSPLVDDVDNNKSDLLVTTDHPNEVKVVGLFLLFDYPRDNVRDTVVVHVSDGIKATDAAVEVVVHGPDVLASFLPWVIAGAVAAAVYFVTHRLKTTVEEVFLVHSNGLPLAHLSRSLTPEKDPDLVASLFTAIRSFARDSFQGAGAGEIRGLELGSHRVYIAQGKIVFLAVLYRGRPSKGVAKRAEEVIVKIEATYSEALKNWSGMMDEVAGARLLLESFYGAKATENIEELQRIKASADEAARREKGSRDQPPSAPPPSPPPSGP